MGDDDVLFRFRLRLFSLAAELGNVRAACRLMGVHPSTYYRWRGPVLRSGLEMLRPRERRAPRMPNQASQLTEQRVVAFSLGHPGLGPRRISATLAQERWGGIVISPNGVWRILRRHGLNRRLARLSLVAGYASPAGPEPLTPAEPRHLEVSRPGELVGFDCFHVGRLSGTSGRVWQYTAIDLATSFVWAELATTPLNPSARKTSALAQRVAADLRAHGWRLERVLSDNGSEFRSTEFGQAIGELGARQTFIRPGRPTTNGAVERVQRTILEECWRPAFARSLVPKMGGLSRDLAAYLRFYNEERAHTGRLTNGRTPLQTLIGARKMRPR
ncbi:MAG TPA: DDE-type integrase/transposase/recombinase [Candidatus Limnocylindria bacterium]|jgi:transposase InsO family protein